MSFLPEPIIDDENDPKIGRYGPLTAFSRPLRLIPEALEADQAAEIEAVLLQIKQETRAELQDLASSSARSGFRQGSAVPQSRASSRSRSSTPALTRSTSSPETMTMAAERNQPLLKSALKVSKTSLKTESSALAGPPQAPADRSLAPLMSRVTTIADLDDDSSDDDHVFVVTSTRLQTPMPTSVNRPPKVRKVAFVGTG